MKPKLIALENIAYGHPGRLLVGGLSFDIGSGQLCLVTGPNGSGKSTLLKVVPGIQPIQGGVINRTIEANDIAYIPQIENTEFHLPMILRDVLDVSSDARLNLEKVLAIGLLEKKHLNLPWNTASGGERKRTLLSRVLLKEPKLLLLDEPMNHLDDESRFIVVEALRVFLNSHPNRGVILVSHGGLEKEERAFFEIVTVELKGSTHARAQ